MTKIDIFSGFLGAGKTTLIKKLIAEAYAGEKIVLIENEFGEIAIDGGFLQDAGVTINEMNSGCICCSLVGDFEQALKQVLEQFSPDRILIEPSGVGKLSDVIRAVQSVESDELKLNGFTTVVDANKCRIYMKNFGEFFNNQVESARCIILSRTGKLSEEKIAAAVALLREHNADATIITTPWEQLGGAQILAAMERTSAEFVHELEEQMEHEEHEHHHHHHDGEECDDPECECHHHHDHDEDEEHEHRHHHHHDGEECDDPECECHHHHDHDEDEDGHEHHHHHHHHHGHDADEVFASWGVETPKTFERAALEDIFAELDSGAYGQIVRCKGIVAAGGMTEWLHFDYVPEEHEIRTGPADVTGRLCVIGAELKEDKLAELFGV